MTSDNPSPGPRPKPGRPSRTPGDPMRSVDVIHGIGALVQELASLVDGSMRCIAAAQRSLPTGELMARDPQAAAATKQLRAAAAALEVMCGLVHNAMQGPTLAIGSPLLSRSPPVTLAEAVDHAVEVIRPAAEAQRTAVEVHVEADAAVAPSGPLYVVVLTATRHALESVRRAARGKAGGGRVEIEVRCERLAPEAGGTNGEERVIVIDIRDSGDGPAGEATEWGEGFGLSLARSVVAGIGGTMELLPGCGAGARRGSVVRVRTPYPVVPEREIGGAEG